MSTPLIDRRWFLGTSAASIGYFFTASATSALRAAAGPNDTIRVAGVGVGGKGSSDIDQAAGIGTVTVICDIDEGRLGSKAKKWPDAATFYDYRKLFEDKVAKTFDAVTVSTPDHNHAWPSLVAMSMGKHVYCQKPLTHTVYEARVMRECARKYKVCTQMGNQGTAANGLRRAVELVQEGILGKVKEIHVWTNRPVWPQAPQIVKRPAPADCPQGVHFDEFLGTAPKRPYANGYHPFKWRGFWDFGTGALGDMACHTANMAFMACELGSPTTIVADATDVNPETCPSSAKVTFQYPSRGEKLHQAPLTFTWYEGKRDGKKVLPPQELLAKVLIKGQKLSNSGSMIVGEKAILYSPNDYGSSFVIFAGEEELAKGDRTPKKLPINNGGDGGMKREWAAAIKANKPGIAISNFDYAGMLTEAILLGNVAIRAGKKLQFDAEKLECPNCPEASQYIKNEYRKGWELPSGIV